MKQKIEWMVFAAVLIALAVMRYAATGHYLGERTIHSLIDRWHAVQYRNEHRPPNPN
jgi:hypothetical protein